MKKLVVIVTGLAFAAPMFMGCAEEKCGKKDFDCIEECVADCIRDACDKKKDDNAEYTRCTLAAALDKCGADRCIE